MTDKEHARKYASESISLAISMNNPKAEDIAFFACLYGLTYKNDEIKELKQQIEKMKRCVICRHWHCENNICWLEKEGKCHDKSMWELD